MRSEYLPLPVSVPTDIVLPRSIEDRLMSSGWQRHHFNNPEWEAHALVNTAKELTDRSEHFLLPLLLPRAHHPRHHRS